MPPFFFMKYIKFKCKEVNHNTSDYYQAISNGPKPQEPEVWILNDGNAVIVFPDMITCYMGSPTFKYVTVLEEADEKANLTTQSNSGIIDGNVLLKAIAIAQNPNLAQSLIKE